MAIQHKIKHPQEIIARISHTGISPVKRSKLLQPIWPMRNQITTGASAAPLQGQGYPRKT